MRRAGVAFVFLGGALTACAPPVEDQPWRVTAPRVVALVAEPPEVDPGQASQLTAVLGSPDGPLEAGVRWVRCEAPPPFSQNEPIASACLAALAQAPVEGPSREVSVPVDACAVFGPDVASASARPRDPDATGGYSQPVGVELDSGEVAFAFLRLGCDPAGVDAATAAAFRQAASPNTNPRVSLTARRDGLPVDWGAELPPGAVLELTADWSASPEERYPYIEPGTGVLGWGLEQYEVSWLSTQGTLSAAKSTTGEGRWTLPPGAGSATLWAVVRDGRGGTGVAVVGVRWR